jgi:hypothetical protein
VVENRAFKPSGTGFNYSFSKGNLEAKEECKMIKFIRAQPKKCIFD